MENGNTATDTATLSAEASKKPETAQDYFGYEPTAIDAEQVKPEVVDYQSEVNRLLKETKVTEDGKFEYPADTPAWAKVAIANEKKFRDTQSTFTKTAQEKKLIEAENEALKSKLAAMTALTEEQQSELELLKHSDPEAYFDKRTEYEANATNQFDTELAEVRTKTAAELELERRERYITDFNANREVKITQELIDSEVPAKFLRQLENNETTFEEFLTSVASYVDTPKVVGKKEDVTQVTNLSEVAGGTTPSAEKKYDNLADNYAKLIF
jgi:hypothetical protein